MHTHTNSPEREGRLIAFAGGPNAPNSAQEYLENQQKKQKQGPDADPSGLGQVNLLATTTTDKLRNASMRGIRSLGLESETVLEREVSSIIKKDAKEQMRTTGNKIGLASNAAAEGILEVASKANTTVVALQTRKNIAEKSLNDLKPEAEALGKQAGSMKKILGVFSSPERYALIAKAERLGKVVKALGKEFNALKSKYIKDTLEGQIEEKAKIDLDSFTARIQESGDPALIAQFRPLLLNYMAGTDTQMEDAIGASALPGEVQQSLINEAQKLRDGEKHPGTKFSKRSLAITTALGLASLTVPYAGLALGGYLAWRGTKLGVGATRLALKTGHWTEKGLHKVTMATILAEQVRAQGDLNPNGPARMQKLAKLPPGSQVRVFQKDGTPVDLGTTGAPTEATNAKGVKEQYLNLATKDGETAAINLTNPRHPFCLCKRDGSFINEEIGAFDLNKPKDDRWKDTGITYFSSH